MERHEVRDGRPPRGFAVEELRSFSHVYRLIFGAGGGLLPPASMQKDKKKPSTTFNNGYLGSRNDEERSEMRYVV